MCVAVIKMQNLRPCFRRPCVFFLPAQQVKNLKAVELADPVLELGTGGPRYELRPPLAPSSQDLFFQCRPQPSEEFPTNSPAPPPKNSKTDRWKTHKKGGPLFIFFGGGCALGQINNLGPSSGGGVSNAHSV